MTELLVKQVIGLALALTFAFPVQVNRESAPDSPRDVLPVCDQERAVLLVQQQVDDAAEIGDTIGRIAVLIRAADLLWPYREDSARETFIRAYEFAEKRFQEKGDENRSEGRLRIELEDQRFAVMAAIARRDSAWARRLAERIAETSRIDAEKEAASTAGRLAVAEKLLGLASSLVSVDHETAIRLAKITFQSPATEGLATFLYKLAAMNQSAGDQLYREASQAYVKAPVREILYLSAYPFGLDRVIGPESLSTSFLVPHTFVGNPGLQQLFIQSLVRRAEAVVTSHEQLAKTKEALPDAAQIYLALAELEALAAKFSPTYKERIANLKSSIYALLSSDARRALLNRSASSEDTSFETYVEKAERERVEANRDRLLAFAVLAAPDDESLDRVSGLAKSVSDSIVRKQLLDWFYFKRSKKAIKQGLLYDARTLAEKVEQLDHRAYLYYEIAAEALKRRDDKAEAREALSSVVAMALKADHTNERARTLLGVAYLYARFDAISAFETMSEAIKTINKLSEPDLTTPRFHQRIEGQTFAHYTVYEVAGFSIENTLRELAPFDFDRALLQVKGLESKSLRSRAIIALAGFCFERPRVEQSGDSAPNIPKKP